MKTVLSLGILMWFVAIGNVAAKRAWNGTIDANWPEDSTRTEFIIKSPSQLAKLAQMVNDGVSTFEGKTITLANDIDLKNRLWQPIGCLGRPFRGHFNGNRRTIRNLKIEATTPTTGLFGYIENGATIENLTIRRGTVINYGTSIDEAYSHPVSTGALVGRVGFRQAGDSASVSDSVVIRYCRNVGVYVSNELDYLEEEGREVASYASALVGYVGNTSSVGGVFLMERCTNTGEVYGNRQVAGLVAAIVNTVAVIDDCSNEGLVSTSGSLAGSLGGLVGYVQASGEHPAVVIRNSINKGFITAEQSLGAAGGIVGAVHSCSLQVESCANTGDMEIAEGESIGGIIGRATYNNVFTEERRRIDAALRVINCYEASTITAFGETVGGIIGSLSGWFSSTTHAAVSIRNNYTAGRFDIAGSGLAAGIIARMELPNGSCRITNNVVALTDIAVPTDACRIAGELHTGQSPLSILAENYAYVADRNWTEDTGHYRRNGEDWTGTMLSMPFNEWNGIRDYYWDFDPSEEFMPKLANVRYEQPDVPNPLYGINSVGNEPEPEKPLTCYTSGSNLYVETTTSGDLSIYNFGGRLYNKRSIPAGLTTVSLPREIYIVNFNGYSEKVAITR